MANIHVLIRDAPTMLRQILEQVISAEPDMELVADPPDTRPGPDSPDVLIVGGSDVDAGERGRALLARWPHSRVLMITGRGRQVVLYELVPHCRSLGELSPNEVVDAIRTAVKPERISRPH